MFSLTSPSEPSPRGLASRSSPFNFSLPATSAGQFQPVYLEFEDLPEFDPVDQQYASLGIHFTGAIAIRPSNPIFIPSSGTMVLMPSKAQQGITAEFCQPLSLVRAIVVGTQPVTLTALDINGQLISQVSIGSYRYTWASDLDQLTPLPQQHLQLQANEIAAVIFNSDAPFTLDNLFLG